MKTRSGRPIEASKAPRWAIYARMYATLAGETEDKSYLRASFEWLLESFYVSVLFALSKWVRFTINALSDT